MHVCTLFTFFCMFGADLYAQLVFIYKISASEFSQKVIKSGKIIKIGWVCAASMDPCTDLI